MRPGRRRGEDPGPPRLPQAGLPGGAAPVHGEHRAGSDPAVPPLSEGVPRLLPAPPRRLAPVGEVLKRRGIFSFV